MRSVYMMTDLEGVAGVVSFEDQAFATGRYYDQAKRLVTAEVNAAVDGLLDAGVEDVLICDGHGAGGLWFEDIHPKAKLLHGRPITIPQLFAPLADYEAVVMIGQHAMAGVPTSNQNHTQSSQTIDYMKLNGQLIGEIAQFALYCGARGKPLIYLSGEIDACKEAEALIPGITTTSVKQGLSRGAAISLSASAARSLIRDGIRQAIEHHQAQPIAPLTWPGPYCLEKRFFHTHVADQAALQPGAIRVDSQTVRYEADDILSLIYR
ncbi:MAG: M55 family metallopeptidase [Chloroflexi bacterium]|nr:M55 family metallopeptidase [Chloroflexota bacterium]